MDQLVNLIQYRSISLLVRPARVAVLIPEKDEYWKHVILQVFEWCSRVWGGAYFVIIPTDGKVIKDAFWRILEEYSPDNVAAFIPTFHDLELADPEKYNSIVSKNKEAFLKDNPEFGDKEFNDLILQHLNSSSRLEFGIEDSLQQQIKQRLAPFHHDNYIIQGYVSALASVPFPLTQLDNIVQQGGLKKVYVVDGIEDVECSLIFYSNWGLYKSDFEKMLTEKGVTINHIPKDVGLGELLGYSVNKQVDMTELKFRRQFRERSGNKDDSWYPEEDIAQLSPYQASLLKTGRYRTLDSHYWDEPVTLVAGNTVDDFCLYYSLSRIQDAVYWMPEIKVPEKGAKPDAGSLLSSTVAQAIMRKINYGHSKNTIVITSLSMSTDELENAKKQLPYLVYRNEAFGQGILIESSPWLIEKTTYRIIEENNYTSLYTEVFQNNKGVGNIPTPKPKNFGQVPPYDHRWITELNIEGYRPPQLHFLGKEIIDLRGLPNETRIAKTGICYQCPNIGYFGGDIDVTLVRPKINIVEPFAIFEKYFAEAGYIDIRLSDKGSFTQQTIEKFGSLDEIGTFLQKKSNRDFLSLFLIEKSTSDPKKGEIIYANKRAYVNFAAIEHLIGVKEETIELIDNFIQKGILYRGTMLHCSYCRQSDWYGLDELDQTFVCHRCKHKQTIQLKNWKEGKEPGWFYKLDEIIFKGLTNNMDIPLLTLFQLKKDTKASFLFVPELEFRKDPKSSLPELEVDLCCIKDGRIIIGECRKKPIDKDLIDKIITFSGALLKSPDELIFSTQSSKISDDIMAYVNSKIKIPFTFLTNSDLGSPI